MSGHAPLLVIGYTCILALSLITFQMHFSEIAYCTFNQLSFLIACISHLLYSKSSKAVQLFESLLCSFVIFGAWQPWSLFITACIFFFFGSNHSFIINGVFLTLTCSSVDSVYLLLGGSEWNRFSWEHGWVCYSWWTSRGRRCWETRLQVQS